MKKLSLFLFTFVLFLSIDNKIHANEIYNESQGVYKAKIINIGDERVENVGLSDTITTTYKNVTVSFIDGQLMGQTKDIESDIPNLKKGQNVYINHVTHIEGDSYFTIVSVDRIPALIFFIILFIILLLIFSGYQGLRSILSLIFSFIVILYVLLPAILAGYNPLFVSVFIAACILFFAIFFTHGFNKESAVAYAGTMIATTITALIAIYAVSLTHLSGFVSDESTYLNMNTSGTLNFAGLLLAGIIVGVLGVLDDIAITQAAIVVELYGTDDKLTRLQVYKKAIRVGKEHVSALVNTLILAYVGTSLPLMLLIKSYSYNIETVLNMEIISTEIIRSIIGSIGLILTVPMVTLLAVFYLKNYKSKKTETHHCGHVH